MSPVVFYSVYRKYEPMVVTVAIMHISELIICIIVICTEDTLFFKKHYFLKTF